MLIYIRKRNPQTGLMKSNFVRRERKNNNKMNTQTKNYNSNNAVRVFCFIPLRFGWLLKNQWFFKSQSQLIAIMNHSKSLWNKLIRFLFIRFYFTLGYCNFFVPLFILSLISFHFASAKPTSPRHTHQFPISLS